MSTEQHADAGLRLHLATEKERKESLVLRLWELRDRGEPVPADLGVHSHIEELEYTYRSVLERMDRQFRKRMLQMAVACLAAALVRSRPPQPAPAEHPE